MYLKSVEIQGFKSFANKIRFEFHNGITGIVGPNGSGKSNVADAVRWVLGEQSAKQLRGGNMQDVIFSGTENRKPMGLASVAITLDNSDHALDIEFEEVTVTRRLYRSGESEYLLNGASCRLKDIQELFYDTGIGKEGYSIIGQGQIDKILSGKPEERRELFDEAAGIVKFKRRKVVTLKKLEQEESNLVRVTDILSELTRQIGPLERQSEKAKVYLNKRDQLKAVDLHLFSLDMEDNKKKLADIEKSITINADQLKDTSNDLQKAKESYEKLEVFLEELDKKIEEDREEAKAAELKKSQQVSNISLLKEQINSIKSNDQQYESRIQSIKDQIAASEKEAKEELSEKEELLKHAKAIDEEKESKSSARDEILLKIEDCKKNIEENQANVIRLLNDRASTKGKIQRYDAMVEQIQIRRAELNQQLLQLHTDAQTMKEKRQEYETAYQQVAKTVAEMKDRQRATEAKIHELQGKLKESNDQLEAEQAAYHRESSRLESLRNLAERYDGYNNSIRRVMEQKPTNPGIQGVVADLISTEKKYESAIETALGGSIQNIVTDNETTAKYLIEYLKRGRFGRATFLPLTNMRGQGGFPKKEVLSEKGVIGPANTLVKTEEMYEKLAEQLLGKTLVVDHIDNAIAIGRKYHHSIRMVTLEGDLLNPGGSMTGGAYKNNSNLLGRKREIEELETSIRKRRSAVHRLQEEIKKNRDDRNVLRDESSNLLDQIREKSIEQTEAKMNLDQLLEKQDNMDQNYGTIRSEIKEIELQIREIDGQKEDIKKELENSQTDEKTLEISTQTLQTEVEQLEQKENGCTAELNEIEIRLSEVKQKISFVDENLARISRQSRTHEEEMREIQQSRGDSGRLINDKEEEIRSLENEQKNTEQALTSLNGRIAERLKDKEEKNKEYRSSFNQREELTGRINLLDKEGFRLSSQKEKLEEFKENRISYMWDEYELTPTAALSAEHDDQKDRKELKQEATKLREEIRKLGPVNVNAIEEYKEQKERHDFLEQQHTDLVEAKKNLEGIIEELDTGMRKQFAEKFAIIRTEFDKVFKELFGGGRGALELVEDEDILEAGIRIISQPPGKKLQNMMQLSGGEKALTAIALLFAIQNLKPSPFCLLDEIEAALDDSNVTRYAQYLHKLTKNTQFIIITHRRGSMAAADRLYGITMQEKGVSALVSVNLIEDDLDK